MAMATIPAQCGSLLCSVRVGTPLFHWGAFWYFMIFGAFILLLALLTQWLNLEHDNSNCSKWNCSLVNGICVADIGNVDDDNGGGSSCWGFGSQEAKDYLPWVYDERNSVWGLAAGLGASALILCAGTALLHVLALVKLIKEKIAQALAPLFALIAFIFTLLAVAAVRDSDSADDDLYNTGLSNSFEQTCGDTEVCLGPAIKLCIFSSVMVLGGLLFFNITWSLVPGDVVIFKKLLVKDEGAASSPLDTQAMSPKDPAKDTSDGL